MRCACSSSAASKVWVPRTFDETGRFASRPGGSSLTLKNVYSGIFAQYANFGWSPSSADPAPADRPLLDRWMLSRLATRRAREVDALLERYDATRGRARDHDVRRRGRRELVRAAQPRSRFYDVDTARTIAPRSRRCTRCWSSVCRLLAPFAPFRDRLDASRAHRRVGAPRTLRRAPSARPRRSRRSRRAMDAHRARSRRSDAPRARRRRSRCGSRSRALVCVAPAVDRAHRSRSCVPLLAAELNVKRVEFARSGDALVTLEAKPNFRSLGKRSARRRRWRRRRSPRFTREDLRAFEPVEPLAVTVDGETHTSSRRTIARSCVARRASSSCRRTPDSSRRSIPR